MTTKCRLFLTLILSANLGGCAFSDPTTLIQAGPFGSTWKFSDNKDNDISFDEASYNSKTGDGTLKGVVIRNNSSDPRKANVLQMEAHTRQIEAMGGLLERLVNALASIIPLVPNPTRTPDPVLVPTPSPLPVPAVAPTTQPTEGN